MKAEIEKTGKPRGKKKEMGIRELKIEIPADALELVSTTIILDLDTTPPDEVIANLGPGVDIIKPGEPSSLVLEEKTYKIRRSSRKLALLPVKSE